MATRRFVLEPSVEIAPDLPHPTAGCSLRDLLGTISAPCPLVSMVGVPGSGASEVATAVADATMARLIPAPRPAPLETDDVATWLEVAERWARATAPRQARRDEGADDCGVARNAADSTRDSRRSPPPPSCRTRSSCLWSRPTRSPSG
jgi:hypothetical protein